MAKYKFLKDYKGIVKKGQILEGQEIAGSQVPKGATSAMASSAPSIRFTIIQPNDVRQSIQLPKTELGKTIEKVVDDKAPTNTGKNGNTTTDATTTTNESKSLFTTKNVLIGVAVLTIGYFAYKKFIKKGKK